MARIDLPGIGAAVLLSDLTTPETYGLIQEVHEYDDGHAAFHVTLEPVSRDPEEPDVLLDVVAWVKAKTENGWQLYDIRSPLTLLPHNSNGESNG